MVNELQKSEVVCVVVFYNFDLGEFKKNLNQLSKNFIKVLVLNNSPNISLDNFKRRNITIKTFKKNIGLSKALNIGVKYFIKNKKIKFISFFDQDSYINDDFNLRMISEINNFKKDNSNTNVSVFFPIIFNRVISSFSKNVHIFPFFLIKVQPLLKIFTNNRYTFPSYAITSGSYIPLNIFKKIGLFNNNFFIDLIDIEWCLRARFKNFKVVCCQKVILQHNIGDYFVSFFFEKYPIHSPLRLYYYFRNSFYMLYLKHIPTTFKINDMFKNILRLFFYLIFVRDKKNYITHIYLGIRDGINKKLGKFNH